MATSSGGLTGPTFEGFPAGINQALRPHDIPDQAAVWLQDVFVDVPGIIRQRGKVSAETLSGTDLATDDVAHGLFSAQAPNDGDYNLAILQGTSAPKLAMMHPSIATSFFTVDWAGNGFWSLLSPPVWSSRAALNRGTMIGTAAGWTAGNQGAALGLWSGATTPEYSTGTITVSRGSTGVTGSGTAWNDDDADTGNVEKGMFLFAVSGTTYTLIGTVKDVSSTTSLTLEEPALADATGSDYLIAPVRALKQRCIKGRITCDTSGTTVTGAGTKFENMASGTWDLFRLSDKTWIGTVDTVTNDTSLDLAANAAIAMSDDQFVGIQLSGTNFYRDYLLGAAPGFLNTTYQNRQFYANNPDEFLPNRVWFSDPNDPEGLDLSADDGDFFDVTSQVGADTPILSIIGMPNAMAILKRNELFALYGTDPTTFELRKIADVGTMSPMSVVAWKNVIIFASEEGVFSFDGTTLTELSVELGQYWHNSFRAWQSNKRAYGMIYQNHYLLHVNSFSSTYSLTRGSIETRPTIGTFALNLDTGAWTFLTNCHFLGAGLLLATYIPVFLVTTDTQGILINGTGFWSTTGRDTVTCYNATAAGPDLYIEMKRYSMGAPELKKNFKQFTMQYIADGDTLTMDTVPGLTGVGSTISKPWPQALVYTNTRRKFQKRTTHLGFRIYPTLGTLRKCEIGPWQVLFKPLRLGRT